jgi:hypothetical protein
MAGALVMILAGCAGAPDRPPAIVIDRTACARCGMLVSEARFAAASRTGAEAARIFDDIGCLVADQRESKRPADRFWFHDAGSGEWIAGPPSFIQSTSIRTPMGGGILAFGGLDDAKQAARRQHDAVITSLSDLIEGGR